MPDDLPITPDLTIPATELWFTASRASGPGGQHVNKTSSRVTLHWDLSASAVLDGQVCERLLEALASRLTREGVLRVSVETERSQHRNREIARERLAALVRDALREPTPRRPTRVPASSRRRRVNDKREVGRKKRLRGRVSEKD